MAIRIVLLVDRFPVRRVSGREPGRESKPFIKRRHGVRHGAWRRYRRTHIHAGRRLIFRTCTVQGARVAAELIWQAQQVPLPLRFFYRGFETEEQAIAFQKLMMP